MTYGHGDVHATPMMNADFTLKNISVKCSVLEWTWNKNGYQKLEINKIEICVE